MILSLASKLFEHLCTYTEFQRIFLQMNDEEIRTLQSAFIRIIRTALHAMLEEE